MREYGHSMQQYRLLAASFYLPNDMGYMVIKTRLLTLFTKQGLFTEIYQEFAVPLYAGVTLYSQDLNISLFYGAVLLRSVRYYSHCLNNHETSLRATLVCL